MKRKQCINMGQTKFVFCRKPKINKVYKSLGYFGMEKVLPILKKVNRKVRTIKRKTNKNKVLTKRTKRR